VAILLTTQYLDEADELADRVAVLDKGVLVAEGSPEELKRRVTGGHIALRFAEAGGLALAAGLLSGGVPDDEALTLRIPSDGSLASLRSVLDRLDQRAVEVESLTVHTPDLDDVFFALTGRADNAGHAGHAGRTDDKMETVR
jgi:ABC-2 type transport system ATP-binding protein